MFFVAAWAHIRGGSSISHWWNTNFASNILQNGIELKTFVSGGGNIWEYNGSGHDWNMEFFQHFTRISTIMESGFLLNLGEPPLNSPWIPFFKKINNFGRKVGFPAGRQPPMGFQGSVPPVRNCTCT